MPVPDGFAADESDAPLELLQASTPDGAVALFHQTRRELSEYLRGARRVFDVPLAPEGTPFQQAVWNAMRLIPHGQTVSYGELACMAGLESRHSRAVGAAVGRNPISILIPCHRVLAGDGTLNGYSGGLARKAQLLRIEGFVLEGR
uniref:methylated-DNA--[protein]-cysteine S-methyltransferase n=1 Tax=Castellaniella defragrans TaxID=75697 RepID=UPI00333F4AE4